MMDQNHSHSNGLSMEGLSMEGLSMKDFQPVDPQGARAATASAQTTSLPGTCPTQDPDPMEVQMCQAVMPCHTDHQGALSAGQLLKWMDTIACLAAERHAGIACVTLSMDDLQFEETVRVGQVITIKARVNRAFTTSMEVGMHVMVQEVETDVQRTVCIGYSTFVGKPVGQQKVVLRPVETLSSAEDKLQHSLASERRRLRLLNEQAFTSLLENYHTLQRSNSNEACCRGDNAPVACAEKTHVESIELVLPPHANHHGNTFGGQIMAWMENAATVAASRLCGRYPFLRSVDMFRFRGSSSVGDRLVFKAVVNNTFYNSCSIEVGVRVEAYNCQEWTENRPRHINSAFLIFQLPSGDTPVMPDVRPSTQDGERRYIAAIARRRIRMAKKHILSCKDEGPLSVAWDKSNQVYLGYNNIAALTVLAEKQAWELNSIRDRVSAYVLEEMEMLCVKVQMDVMTSALHAFNQLADLRQRPLWDKHYLNCEEVEKANNEETVFHVKCSPDNGNKMQDFVYLQSKRQPCKEGDPYTIALRSVTVSSVPPQRDFHRNEIKCVGFIINSLGPNSCRVCYYNQVTSTIMPYVAGALAGWSKSMENTADACLNFLEKDVLNSVF